MAHPEWINKKVLITTDNYFVAPDGEVYRAAHGTLTAILSDSEALGIRTNARSTNWYVQIGNLLIAGCQIHYAFLCENVSQMPACLENYHEGKAVHSFSNTPRIYLAD